MVAQPDDDEVGSLAQHRGDTAWDPPLAVEQRVDSTCDAPMASEIRDARVVIPAPDVPATSTRRGRYGSGSVAPDNGITPG